MDKISKIKTDLRIREWAEMVRECSRSGLTVRKWCGDNGINIKTYYYRLKRVRDCICDSKFNSSIDNNCSSTHHDIVPRKNFLFSDTSKGAEASALCFTMIECAKLNKLDVFGYLIYLLSELPKLGEKPSKQQLIRMLPWSEELPEYCKIPKRV